MLETAAALVYDSAVFGPASPVLGHRYRFAVAPAFGSISSRASRPITGDT
jgi:hypothetical protein